MVDRADSAAPDLHPAVLDPARLQAVRDTGLLDSPPEPAFDQLTSLAALLLRTPLAFLTLIDEHRSFWKSCVGAGCQDRLQDRQHPVADSFCQYVVADAAPLIVDDTTLDPRTRDNPSVTSMGIRAWAGFPLVGPTGHILGSFCVVDLMPRSWSANDVEVLRVLAAAASSQVALTAAGDRDRRARDQLRRLAAASDLLLSARDPAQVLQRMAGLAVPDLAVWCTAWVPAPSGAELIVAGVAGPAGEIVRWPPIDLDGVSPSARAFRTGKPQSVPDLTVMLGERGPDDAITAVTAQVRGGPTYSVPLQVQQQTLGAMTLLRRRGDRPFDAEDEDFARQLASQAASVLLVTRRHQQERETAEVLQRSMLSTLPALSELELYGYYRPAGGSAHIGGDWYDAVDLGAGRTALIIGDVMGRGMRAAAVMGQLRTAARTLARLDLPPQQILELLDELVSELPDGQIVTCFYGVHDPAAGTLAWCSAGHPPPVICRRSGTGRLHGEPGAPLGAGFPLYSEHRDPLLPSDVLCLFTDGLIEDRRRDLDVGLAHVEQLLAGPWTGLAEIAGRLVDEVAEGEEDDVALLLARVADRAGIFAADKTARVLELELSGGPEIVGTARHWARSAVLAWHGDGPCVDTVTLVTSELVTIALMHAIPPMRLRLRGAPGKVYVEVFDHGHDRPRLQVGELDDEHGQGMLVVDAIAHRWGSRSSGGGKVVWAEVLVDAAAAAG